jgi:hypothetical protein
VEKAVMKIIFQQIGAEYLKDPGFLIESMKTITISKVISPE